MSIPVVPLGPYDLSGPSDIPNSLGHQSLSYGPKRVKTPNMEIEQFDPRIIQQVSARENAAMPHMHNLGFSVAVPNLAVYQSPRSSRTP